MGKQTNGHFGRTWHLRAFVAGPVAMASSYPIDRQLSLKQYVETIELFQSPTPGTSGHQIVALRLGEVGHSTTLDADHRSEACHAASKSGMFRRSNDRAHIFVSAGVPCQKSQALRRSRDSSNSVRIGAAPHETLTSLIFVISCMFVSSRTGRCSGSMTATSIRVSSLSTALAQSHA